MIPRLGGPFLIQADCTLRSDMLSQLYGGKVHIGDSCIASIPTTEKAVILGHTMVVNKRDGLTAGGLSCPSGCKVTSHWWMLSGGH